MDRSSPPTSITPRFRTIDGLRIRCAEGGAAQGPTLLLTSPWPESIYAFTPMWDTLAAHARLFAIDLPGFGASERRDDVLSPRGMGAFLADLIDEVGLDHPHVVAPDVGTSAALFAAAEHPERIASVVVGTGGASIPLDLGEPLRSWVLDPDLDRYRAMDPRAIVGAAVDTIAGGVPDAVRADYVDCYAGDRFVESMRYVRSYPEQLPVLAELLPTITTPVTIINGRHDRVVPVSNAEFLDARLPDSRVEIIDAGHFVWEEEPAQYASIVLGAIASLAPPRPGVRGLGMTSLTPVGCLGLVLHPRTDPTEVVEKLARWARSHGKALIVDAADAARVPGVEAVPTEEFLARAGAVVSLGGDGTMLGALRLVAPHPVPVLGVNLGHLGFLVEIEPAELDDALDRLDAGDFTVEEHSAAVLIDGSEESVAFNDVALASVPGEGTVQASLAVNGRPSGRYRCDAFVIATPIGSTAYSYAAGGPLVSPMLDALIISPVAPISGISRPAVISADEPIVLTLSEGSGRPALQVDGTIRRRMAPGEALEVRLRPRAGLVVRLDADRYQRRSGIKLSLLDLPFLPDEMRDLLPAREPAALTADT